MADFVDLQKPKEATAVPLITDSFRELDYLNDSDEKRPFVDSHDKYANEDDSKSQLLLDSFKWPLSIMSDTGAVYLPFVVAGVVAFWAAPMFLPQTNLGSALLTGYVAGGLEYYIQFQNKTYVKTTTANKL